MEPTPTYVLLVDDDASLRELARRSIEAAHPNIQVTALASPGEALELLGSQSVDCIVTDYAMPGMDGMAFLEAIRQVEPDLPVVFFTGKGSEELASEAISAGVTDYIRKENGTEVFQLLGTRIETLVRVRRAEEEARDADQRVRELFDRVSDAVMSLDEYGRVTYLNNGAESVFGSSEELEGEVLTDAVPSLADSAFEQLVDDALESQQSQSQRFELPVGERLVSVTVYPGRDGVSVFVQDLTPLKQREERIEQLTVELDSAESRFRALTAKLSRPIPPHR